MTTPTISAKSASPVAALAPAARWLRIFVVGVAAIVLAHMLDVAGWTYVRDSRIYERDWGRLLRVAGFLPTWLLAAGALWYHNGAVDRWRSRSGVLALAPTVAGVLAEILKLLLRRLRPGATSPAYVFRAFSDHPFSNLGMGLPSSHVIVATAAATVLARLFPRVRWLWYALAAGCAYTRVAAGAHYVSDTVVAAVLGWVVAELMVRWATKTKPPEAKASGGADLLAA